MSISAAIEIQNLNVQLLKIQHISYKVDRSLTSSKTVPITRLYCFHMKENFILISNKVKFIFFFEKNGGVAILAEQTRVEWVNVNTTVWLVTAQYLLNS